MARAHIDGQSLLYAYGVRPFSSFKAAKVFYEQRPVPYQRVIRHGKVTGTRSTQETLSFID